jgi:hypothetical protein
VGKGLLMVGVGSIYRAIRINGRAFVLSIHLFRVIKEAIHRGFEIQTLVIIRRAIEGIRTAVEGDRS